MMAMPPIGILGGFQNALTSPGVMQGFAQQEQPRAAFQPQRMPTGFLNTLGRIGDVLAVMGGRQGVYEPWRRQREVQNAFGAWAADPEDPETRANFLAADPASAWKVLQDQMSEELERDKLGLQRRKLEIDAEQGKLTPFQRDAIAAGAPPGSPQYKRLLESRYNQMRLYGNPQEGYDPDPNWRPIFDGMAGDGDSEQPATAPVQQPPSSAVEYLRANPNLKARFDEKYGAGAADRVLGGAGAQAPRPFP